MTKVLLIKCPKCRTNKDITANETIEATTSFYFVNGKCIDTNNEYGSGIQTTFVCNNCGHSWTGRKGVSIDNYTENEQI